MCRRVPIRMSTIPHICRGPLTSLHGRKLTNYRKIEFQFLNRQAIRSIMKHTSEVNAINMEDVLFTGILAKLANVSLSQQHKMFRVVYYEVRKKYLLVRIF
jgi:hypothetical protein